MDRTEGITALTARETQVAERIAWGASQKEVAHSLGISRRTVDNIVRNIYRKLGIGKANELSAWWFCTKFGISFDLSPMKRTIGALSLVVVLITGEVMSGFHFCRYRNREIRTEVRLSWKRNE